MMKVPNYVYKYRSGNSDVFVDETRTKTELERDLQSVEKNILYASRIGALNDPNEGLVFSDKIKEETIILSKILGTQKLDSNKLNSLIDEIINLSKEAGIYSLAGSHSHELLWAHYANSHRGFCLEYDFDELINMYSNEEIFQMKVDYSLTPPELSLSDTYPLKKEILLKKMLGVKSKYWEYEGETRIVFDKPYLKHYNPYALKSICFGLRMPFDTREEIMKRLTGRDLKFYEIIQVPNTYTFERKEITNNYVAEFKHLKEIPNRITGIGNVSFSITKLKYDYFSKKGTLETTFEKSVSEKALKWFAHYMKEHLFSNTDKVFMMHRIDDEPKDGICWARTDYKNTTEDPIIQVNDYRLNCI
ncbi:DUF2971 domain-containing protein [Flectobacillus sp. DC10W]|uniref:DUF2971 domain-containing protein n=1 Tax=Flectobacillus longus TaxID=2984207 RepID=A0ABT6YS12_9BACT|nr:DUF2971 domain-containing protein [Flectobacillus longus]MDI9866320.1 DUF2971 domain-containing protein [Flectobacillus longus]